MKKLTVLLFISFVSLTSFTTKQKNVVEFTNDFCRGWEAGYKNGFCEGKIHCILAVIPMCPLPQLFQDDYMSGYHRGYLRGLSDRR
jgi:hypothetical protein